MYVCKCMSVQDNTYKWPWLWEVKRGNSCISGIHWLYFNNINCMTQILLTYNCLVPVAKNSSVYSLKLKIELMEEYSEAKSYKIKPE